ncbi:uncharacterized protein BDV17DRAFT_261760 [Aspergillus undulatus]|uniref:uncharacterized protein n=1 Tax=Aspergillus undulatus TaxID=1810928 RepID=UPI003CCE5185
MSSTFIMTAQDVTSPQIDAATPQSRKVAITIYEHVNAMTGDHNQKEFILSDDDSFHEIAKAVQLLQNVMRRIPYDAVGTGPRSRIFIRLIPCIDLTASQASDSDAEPSAAMHSPNTPGPHCGLVTNSEDPENMSNKGIETISNSPLPPIPSQAMSKDSQPARSQSTPDVSIPRKRKRGIHKDNTSPPGPPRRSARLGSAAF